jgi:hypothetical protein
MHGISGGMLIAWTDPKLDSVAGGEARNAARFALATL